MLRLSSFARLLVPLLPVFAAACSAPPGAGEDLASSNQAVTVCAGGTTVKGVNVSTYQGTVNWTDAHAAGLDFAIARVSDGTTTPDDTFAANWAGIKAAGMVRGVYQFFRASEDPTAQADLLIKAVGTFEAGDLPPVADVEVLDGETGATLVANLATWVKEIEAKTGRTPMIYASPGFWDALPSVAQFSGETSWVANWGVTCPDTSTPWTAWSFWQNADNGTVNGISGAVNTDVFNGSLAQLQAFGGSTPEADAGKTEKDAGDVKDSGKETDAAKEDSGEVAPGTENDGGSSVVTPPVFADAGTPPLAEDDGGDQASGETADTAAKSGGCSVARGASDTRDARDMPMWAALAGVAMALSWRRRRRLRS